MGSPSDVSSRAARLMLNYYCAQELAAASIAVAEVRGALAEDAAAGPQRGELRAAMQRVAPELLQLAESSPRGREPG